MKKGIITCLFVIACRFSAAAQIFISWHTLLPDHFMIDDLWNLSISKSSSVALDCQVEVRIETNSHIPVMTISTGRVLIQQQTVNLGQIRSIVHTSIEYGNNNFSATLQQTGSLPMGDYIFCATVTAANDFTLLGVNCEERSLQGSSPPYLITPYNEATIKTKNPLLIWHGPTPGKASSISYQLMLAKMNSNQQPEQAIHNNLPLLNIDNISGTILDYSTLFPPLEVGSSYAWNVQVYYDQQFFGSTETWKFTVADIDTMTDQPVSGSYQLINESRTDGFYLASQFFRIGYDNRANDPVLKYRIIDTDTRKEVSLHQDIPLHHGINMISLDLRKEGLKESTPYLLLVQDGNGTRYQSLFYYIKS